MTTFDDLTLARSIMADREREAMRLALARMACGGASCSEGRLASLRSRVSRAIGDGPARAAACC